MLTEPTRFDGALAHLQQAAQALQPLRVPAMRKDFLVDPYQVLEARAAGAGGVLVILRMLSRGPTRRRCSSAARELRLFVLLEAFDERDIAADAELVAAHAARGRACSRASTAATWRTLQVVPERLLDARAALAARACRAWPRAASAAAADARAVARAGYRARAGRQRAHAGQRPGDALARGTARARARAARGAR